MSFAYRLNLQPNNIDTIDYYSGKGDFYIPQFDSAGSNFNNNPGSANMFNTEFEYLIKRPIDGVNWKNDQSSFTPTSLTAEQINIDKIFNQGIRDYLKIRPPAVQTVDWAGGLLFWWKYIYSELMSLTGYQFRIYNRIFDGTFLNGKGTLAIRLHRFDYAVGNQYLPVMSIVDVATGEEKYRRVLGTQGTDERIDNTTINGLIPVSKGILQSQTSKSILEQMKIGACFWIEPAEFPAWDKLKTATDTAITQGSINKKTTNYSQNIINSWIKDEVASNNFLVQGLIVRLGEAHLIAVDKPDNEPKNYIFGISFLPWNNYAYNIYDLQNRTYVSPSPFNESNFMTLLKLIGMGFIVFELIEKLINYF